MSPKNIKKLYYSISEIGEMLDIKQSVIRYWEGEFKELKPQKNRAGNRIYKKDDIAVIRLIRYYMHEKHLSIQETREMIMHLKSEDLFKRKLDELTPPETDEMEITEEPEQEKRDDLSTDDTESGQEEMDEDNEEEILFPVEEIPEISKKDDLPEIVEKKDEEEGKEEAADDVPEQNVVPSAAEEEQINEEKEVVYDDSREEMRKLLKKISSNIRDIIDILNEKK